jgi:tRNA threonylcarbamoyladenosine biosynthesis protein TsaE
VTRELTVTTADEMRELGRRLASALTAGDLVILSGGLGAGKTTLTKGIGDGLGVRGPITSPTFVIARVHPPIRVASASPTAPAPAASPTTVPPAASPTTVPPAASPTTAPPAASPTTAPGGPRPALVHADAYRLGGVLELDDLDLDTDLASSVTVVEWGEGLAEGLSADRLEIAIEAVTVGASDTTDPDDLAGDMPRTVRISSVGQRWEGIELPLPGLADRL